MIKFSRVFSDGMIIQRGKDFNVWGYADSGVRVILSGGGKTAEGKVSYCNGKFTACFGGVCDTETEYEISACCGDDSVGFKARFGDVYLMLGQSNMSYVLSATERCDEIAEIAAKTEIAALNLEEPVFEDISMLTRPVEPREDLLKEYKWISGKSEAIRGVSAIGVATAVNMSEKRSVPVGIVVAAMGGLSVESYVPRKDYERDRRLMEFGKKSGRYQSKEEYNKVGAMNYTQIAGVYNEKIAPLEGLNFDGIVWYLGESSAYDYQFAKAFKRAMKIIVKRYCEYFGCRFVGVGIACEYYPYGDTHGYEYINEVLGDMENCSEDYTYVPIYDIEPRWLKCDGDLYFHPIHPVNKLPIAERVAYALCGGKFPRIESVDYEDGKAICKVRGGKLKQRSVGGFTLAGENGRYYPATATVFGDRVQVECPDVVEPRKLTYAFKLYQQDCTLGTESGLPVIEYRTDRERVTKKYCFTPAYVSAAENETYENCFGWRVGTCRKTKVWRGGEIYGGENTQITVCDRTVTVRAEPKNTDYFLFGVSPALCMSGHNSHIADYGYLNFELRAAEGDVIFLGVAVRSASGDVYMFDLCNGGECAGAIKPSKEFAKSAVSLHSGMRCDEAKIGFDKSLRRSFVQAEFVFRSRQRATVELRNITLSDKDMSQKSETTTSLDLATRADINIMK